MMKRLRTDQEWFDRLIPEGIPTHSSTLVTGPGGSGKPLIGNLIAAAWLRQGGSVVFLSLQYPSRDFIVAALKSVAQLNLDQYGERVVFVELDVTREDVILTGANHFKANLVKPDIWDATIEQACSAVPDEGPGILVFGSALNLLLFSPTYGKAILERMKNTVQYDKRHTYLFTVSTTAMAEEISQLEGVADNVIQSHSEKPPLRLYMSIARMKDSAFVADEIQVPIRSELLGEVREVADHSRLRVIPLIQKL
jgi:KaiC/GvpD/RAD55 family RecA-like ATPase